MSWWNQEFCGAMGNYIFEHLKSINLKHYDQTCSNNHLWETTNAESAQANSHPIVTIQDNRLSNATSDHFFDFQMKKNLSKTATTKLYPAKECKKKQKNKQTNKKHKEQCIKNKPLSDFEHVYMRPKVNSNCFDMSFCLHGNLHADFTAASFQTKARPYCTRANIF